MCDPPVTWDSLGAHYDRVEFSDETFDIPSTEKEFSKALIERFPHDRTDIEHYFALVRRASLASVLLFVYKCLPWHGRWATWLWLRRPGRDLTLKTTEQVLSGITTNDRLKRLLTAQWGYHGTPPVDSSFAAHSLVTSHFFRGGCYPRGGGRIFAERLLRPLVEKEGGTVTIRARVEQILFSDKKATGVRLKSGQVIAAKRVFSDAGAQATAQMVQNEPRFDKWRREVNGFPSTSGHVALFLGLDEGARELGLGAKNLWVYEGDHSEIRRVDELPYPTDSFEPSGFWFSFSSEKDGADHTQGDGHCAQVITFVPLAWFAEHFKSKRGRRGPAYDALKLKIQAGILLALERRFPGVGKHIVHAELSTPASTHHFTGRPCGSVYGLATVPQRFWSSSFGTRTPSPNLFLTGSDAAMVGVMGALAGGLLAAFTASPWRTILYLIRAFRKAQHRSRSGKRA